MPASPLNYPDSAARTCPNKILSLESLFRGLPLWTPRFKKTLYFLPVAANFFAPLYKQISLGELTLPIVVNSAPLTLY